MGKKALSNKVMRCFRAFGKNRGMYAMLAVYFLAQIILSGLSSFIIPFFTNRAFSDLELGRSFYIGIAVWFGFAVLASLCDYYGNRYNLKAYYRINEEQYRYQLERYLGRGYNAYRSKGLEPVVARLTQDTQTMTDIVLWVVGMTAMLTSFAVVLAWGAGVYPVALLVFVPQCILSVVLKTMADNRIALVKDCATKGGELVREYHLALNNEAELLRGERFIKILTERLRLQRKQNFHYAVQENVLQFFSEVADQGLDLAAKVLCLYVFYRSGCFDGAVILPFFTVQATFRNQFLSFQEYASSVRQNSEAVERIESIMETVPEPKVGTTGEIVCRIKDAGLEFEGKKVLRGINLEIREGEKIAIVGENGSGKTTLLRMILGLVTPDTGECLTKTAAYSPVNAQLFPGTFAENVSYLREQQQIEQSNEKLKALMGREDVCCSSGGEQKLLSHFRAMMFPGEILVMDEPMAALDGGMASYCAELLSNYKGTLIMTTHENSLLQIADRVLRMEDGRIV